MTHRHPTIACILGILLTLSFVSLAWSQAAKASPEADKTGADQPASGAGERASESPKSERDDEAQDDPGVAAILATKPATPADRIRAAKILADLGRSDLGKSLLKQVLEAKLPSEDLADLGEKMGSALFIGMSGSDSLQPEGRFLADAVLTAMASRREGGEYIETMVRQLQDASPDQRFLAMVSLQETPLASIGPLMKILADPARSAEHANVRTTLAGMGRLGRDAAMSVLAKADPGLRIQVIQVLSEMPGRTTEIALLAPALSEKSEPEVRQAACSALKRLGVALPSRQEAASQLVRLARNYFDGRQAIEGVVEGKVTMWQWDAGQKRCIVRDCAADNAGRESAARWASDAYLLAPEDRETRRLYLAARLDLSRYAEGLDQPWNEEDPALVEAKQMGVRTLEDVLVLSTTSDSVLARHAGAGTAAARLLGQIGSAADLLYQGVDPAPLARAVRSRDRRVRLDALKSIVHLQPTKPYPGSSAVPPALAFFATSNGTRQAIAAGPVLQQSRDVAGMMASMGLQSEVATTGQELLQLAAASPDCELAMIDVGIARPPIGILLQQLRRDERTAFLRVGLFSRAGMEMEAEHAAHDDPLSMAFAKPADEQILQRQLEQLALIAPQDFVPAETRLQQALDALDLLAELGRSKMNFYDLRRVQETVIKALYTPKLSAKAIGVLVHLNSAAGQEALVNVASQLTLPLDVRLAAAKAFREHTQKYGILLTTDQIQRQYQRYNESEKLDAGVQQVLGLILDCIEAPTKQDNSKKEAAASPKSAPSSPSP